MADKKNIEVIVANKGRKEGKGGKDAAAPPKEDEVGGRYRGCRIVSCPHCGAIRYFVEETTGVCIWYTCGNCGGAYSV
jgi:hypothetical protein